MMCDRCELDPCACRYIVKFGNGQRWAWKREEVLRMWDEPSPIIDGRETYHYSTCPCPKCWSLAQSTFKDYPNVIPLPDPPDKPLADDERTSM